MEFINRKKEILTLKSYFEHEPANILVVYGPKSTGKTTLLHQVIQDHLKDKKYAVNSINLRRVLIYDFKSFLDIFFQKNTGEKVKDIVAGVTVNVGFFKVGLDDEALLKKNAFKVMEDQLIKANQKGLRPIIILDEIQNLKDIYLNGERRLLDELFNFFVGLTKETHLAHVVLASSDSFFISRIYDSASLMKTADFLLVNQLEKIEVENWLKKQQFSSDDIQFIWEHSGGNTWEIEQYILARKKGESIEHTYQKFLNIALSKLDRYLIFNLKNAVDKQFFEVVNQQIAQQGMCFIPNLTVEASENVLAEMVNMDLWFYDGMNRRIIANSESVRRAILILVEQ